MHIYSTFMTYAPVVCFTCSRVCLSFKCNDERFTSRLKIAAHCDHSAPVLWNNLSSEQPYKFRVFISHTFL